MADHAEELRSELAALLARHDATLTDAERADLLGLEQRAAWRPGSRPTRPEPTVSAFLELFDRAEQEELTYRSVPEGSVDELRRSFRETLARD
jgi:hypothetical protein